MIIIIFPLFIMIHTPPLTRIPISSSSVRRCTFRVTLKCLFHHVTSRLTAGGRHDKWQMSTHFRYHPHLCCHYLFSYRLKTTCALASDPSQSHGSKMPVGNTASYFSPTLWFSFSSNEGRLFRWRFALRALSVTHIVLNLFLILACFFSSTVSNDFTI